MAERKYEAVIEMPEELQAKFRAEAAPIIEQIADTVPPFEVTQAELNKQLDDLLERYLSGAEG